MCPRFPVGTFGTYGSVPGAQAWEPPVTTAHTVPLQQNVAIGSQRSPGAVQIAPPSAPPVATQAV